MAVKKTKAATKLLLKVQTGTNKQGAPVYSRRTVQNVNPALDDAAFLAVGKGLSALQSRTVNAILRQDVATLEEE